MMCTRASAEKFPGGGGQREKRPKNSKKSPKIALLSLFQEGQWKKDRKIEKHQKIALLSLYLL